MKKTKKEKQPVVTLYDVWKEGVTKRVILSDGTDVRLKGNTMLQPTPFLAVDGGIKANVEFTPNGEWCRFDYDRLWVETKKSVVAYVFPVETKINLSVDDPGDLLPHEAIDAKRAFESPHTSTRCVQTEAFNPYSTENITWDRTTGKWWQFWK